MTSASKAAATSAKETARARRESRVLRRAGLDEDVSTVTIKRLLMANRISTRGALIDALEMALPDDDEEGGVADVDDPDVLLEREYKFSLASSGQTLLAGGLGVVNLGGALYLGGLLNQYALYGVRLPSYLGLVQQFFPLLLGYAALFNAIPLVRSFFIKRENARIQKRNKTRRSWKAVLERGAGSVKRKMLAAKKIGSRVKRLGSGSRDIVFDTSREMAEVESVKQKSEMKDFDDMLE